MGRGPGPRQVAIIEQLTESGRAMFVSELMTDPDDRAERRLVLAAIRALKRRDLVETYRTGNPERVVSDWRALQLGDIVEWEYRPREINEQRVHLVNRRPSADVRTMEQQLADIAALPAPPKA